METITQWAKGTLIGVAPRTCVCVGTEKGRCLELSMADSEDKWKLLCVMTCVVSLFCPYLHRVCQGPGLSLPDDMEMQRLEASLNACLNIDGTFHVSTIQVRQYKKLTTSIITMG